MPRSVDEFCVLLARSRLHSPASIETIRERWHVLALRPHSTADFVAWLVARNYLTPYQAKLLEEGKPDNFLLQQYKILDRIGKGRMAGVYKAVDLQGRPVALKVLPPSKARNPDMLARFQREASLATQLNHAGIVRTLEYAECKGLHFLVMEYLEGQTLEELLDVRGRLQPLEAARLGLLTARALQHIHEKGLIHRDLKPGNLMLTPTPLPQENTWGSVVKILDIGMGRALFDPDSRDGQGELTNDGDILGTPDYMAPEQARDARRADARADLYSLGCILYHAVSGRPPFPDENLLRQILRHASQPPTPLHEAAPGTPAELSKVVGVLLAKDPNDRYQSATQIADALQAILGAQARRPHTALPCN
jgi:serine/threonine protein kinase